jgi:hypothetical protein
MNKLKQETRMGTKETKKTEEKGSIDKRQRENGGRLLQDFNFFWGPNGTRFARCHFRAQQSLDF